MKIRIQLLAIILGLGLVFALPAVAQEEQAKQEPAKDEPAKVKPVKDEPAKEEPAKEEPAKEEAAKPPAEAAPAAAPAAAAVPEAPAAPAAPKELSSCAKAFQPLADSYKKAYDDMEKWIAQIDSQTGAANEKVVKLQAQIQANDAEISKAKLAGDKSKAKTLETQNKQLWTDLNASKKTLATSCSAFGKEASERTKQYEAATDKALADLKAQAK